MKELKFLADVNIEQIVIETIKQMGYEIKAVSEINLRMKDKEILELAQKEGLILLTNDKDFGELVFRQKCLSNGVILFRIKGENSKEKSVLIRKLLMGYWDKISKHFVVITKKKFRFIPMEGV
jgi:predicted nuclease of predicted toxin-antitoxin system